MRRLFLGGRLATRATQVLPKDLVGRLFLGGRFAPAVCVLAAGVLALTAGTAQAGSILREVFQGLPGNAISDLTNATIYPNNPTLTNFVTDFFEAPTDVDEAYGQRMHGYIAPPLTGNYTFWIASDDNGQLWLSTDDKPANRRLIATVNGWTSPREWGKEVNQQSVAIRLEAGRAYYVAALQKEGTGGDNLAVRWLRPDGLDEGPIPATYLMPFGTSFTPPIIAQQPTNATVTEGQVAAFEIKVQNLDLISYRWFRNDSEILGVSASILSFGPVTMADNGARFNAILTNNLGSTNSTAATLTVLPDAAPPTLVSALNLGTTTVRLIFSEPMAAPGATNPANYRINGGASVTAAAFGADGQTVLLTTSLLAFGTSYTVTVNNVTDRSSTPNPIPPDSTVPFTTMEFAPKDIGSPVLAGSNQPAPGGLDVTAAGRDIGGTSDQFHFSYQQKTGDFDMQTRLAGVTVSDPYLHAGLMARETLDANARFGAVFASSPQLGCFFEARNAVSAATAVAAPPGGFPVNYPQTWLRLRRSGATLAGFASLDGRTWVQLGSTNIASLTNTLYFGLAVCSEVTNQTATAQFRDVAPTVSSAVGTFIPTREPLGPSSRLTGLILSEIMYHPPDRADGRNLEFVEIYNARSIFEDLTGWRLSGDIDFKFPDGFKLQAGEFVAIAAAPDDLKAVYGITNVLGPYTNALPNDAGTVRLRNNTEAIRLEVDYSDNPPWPAAADGAGHSLVLARPSYGENQVRAWAASELIGGSPGGLDAAYPTPQQNVVINEFLAHTDDPQFDFIELYNHSNSAVDLSGCWLTDDAATNKFRIPDNTTIPARGFLSFDQNQLGFALSANGETVYLVGRNASRVLDAIRYGDQENGIASGRSPDGAPTIRRLADPARAANALAGEDIVINEIINPISGDDNDEYVRASQSEREHAGPGRLAIHGRH